MSTPKIWYYPTQTGPLEEIDLLENIRDLQEEPDVLAKDADTYTGRMSVNFIRGRLRVRIIHERFTSAALARKLLTLQTHLDRGGVIGFARDSDKAIARFATTTFLQHGISNLVTSGNSFNYNNSASLSAGDEVVIMSGSPPANREFHTVSTYASGHITIPAPGLVYDYINSNWALIRHRDFFPVLRFPPGVRQNILTHDRRIAYTLDMTLVEDLHTIGLVSWNPDGVLKGTVDGGGFTIPEIGEGLVPNISVTPSNGGGVS